MKTKQYSTALLLIILFLIPGTTQAQSKSEPWKTIFNGSDLKGWSVVGSTGKVWVADSTMYLQKRSNTKEHTLIRTNKKYTNFILELDSKIDPEFNTGIILRSIGTPDTATVSLYGYQVKIDPSPTRKWSGGIFDDYGNGWHWLYTLKDDARARAAYTIGKWNHIRVEAIGNNIKVWVNGIPTCNLINNKYKKGYIALKIHSMANFPEKEKETGYYKNIRIIDHAPEKYVRAMDIPAQKFE